MRLVWGSVDDCAGAETSLSGDLHSARVFDSDSTNIVILALHAHEACVLHGPAGSRGRPVGVKVPLEPNILDAGLFLKHVQRMLG